MLISDWSTDVCSSDLQFRTLSERSPWVQMRTSPSPKQAAASPAAIDAQSRLRRFLPRNSFSADPERDFRDAHDLAVRLHDRWHGVNTEANDKKATLVEIETALMLRPRTQRSAHQHDQIRRPGG